MIPFKPFLVDVLQTKALGFWWFHCFPLSYCGSYRAPVALSFVMALVVGLSPCRAAGLHGYGERREGRQGTVPAAKQFQSDSASKEHTAHIHL